MNIIYRELLSKYNKHINPIIESKSNIRIERIGTDKYKTPIIVFHGGLNGIGNWKDYFDSMSFIVEAFEKLFGLEIWTIDLKVDTLDDIFTWTVGYQ